MGTFVLKWWKEILSVLIIGTLLGIIHFKNGTIETQNEKIISLSSDLAVTKANLTSCRTQINDQNAKIDQAAKASLELNKSMEDLADTLKVVQKDQKTVIAKLREQTAPSSCSEIQEYLKLNVEELSKW